MASWEKDPLFREWLSEKPKTKAYCNWCLTVVNIESGGKADLKKHAGTKKHEANAKNLKMQPTIKTVLGMGSYNSRKRSVMTAELRMAAFLAEHNLAFLSADHMVPLLKMMFPDSEIAGAVKCSRSKVVAIIKNVFGVQQTENVSYFLNANKFSICVDESTDVSSLKLLSIVAKVRHHNDKIRDVFLALVQVERADAIGIYESIVKVFEENNINYKQNMIGFAADGVNVMTGNRHSVATLLRKDCPLLIICKCICHSFALCASKACEKLPQEIESFARDVYNFVQNSPKNIGNFASILTILEEKPRKLLQPAQTRWLSLEAVVKRLIQVFEGLQIFIDFSANIDKNEKAKSLQRQIRNPVTLLYLEFLAYILPTINNLNRLFQRENPTIQVLYREMERLVKVILDCFLKPVCIKDIEINKILYQDPKNFVKLDEMYLGVNVAEKIETLTLEQRTSFSLKCQEFYVELVRQILKRFDFKNEVIKECQRIDPQSLIDNRYLSIIPLAKHFPTVIAKSEHQKLDDEWREARYLNLSDVFNTAVNANDFWQEIFKTTRGSKPAFPNLQELVYAVFSLAVSSANVERTFSAINLNKTKIRNRLSPSALSGIILTKEYIKMSNSECFSFVPEEGLFLKFKSTMYDSHE